MRTSLVLSVIAALVPTGAAFAQMTSSEPAEPSRARRAERGERGAGSRTVGWRWERPTPQGSTVRGACRDAIDALWIAGEVATFGRVSNDLRRFEGDTLRTRADFARIACCPSGVFAVGTEGALVHRDAEGVVREQTLGDPRRLPMLTDVACVGERGVVVASGASEAFVSEDGGRTFEGRAAPQPLYSLFVVEGAPVDASGSTAGATSRPSRRGQPPTSAGATSASAPTYVLLAGGPRGAVARSTDLGRTWTVVRSGVRGNVLAFATRGATELVAVGGGGSAIRSNDAGATWSAIVSGTTTDLFDVASATVGGRGGELVAVGANGAFVLPARAEAFAPLALEGRFHTLVASRGGLLAFGVGGRYAERRGRGAFRLGRRLETSLFAGYADARGRVVAGDRGFIARGSLTGELRPVRSPVVTALHAIAGNAAGVMLAVGAEGVILRSTDRGARWTRMPFERTSNAEGLRVPSTFQAVWLDDAGHALAVGQQGVRARSDDGGRTWTDLSTARDHQRSGIAWHDGALIVVGTGSRIERSEDFGVTWRDEAPPAPGLDLRTPIVTPSGALVVTARPGVVARRDASGRWTTTSLRPEAFFAGLARVAGSSGGELLLVASDGTTYVSRDDGARWAEERRLTREVITGLFVGESTAWATGYWGMLMVRDGR
ncbi:MAG: hypothetical protein MUE69_13575 [Myxococcota bacterium]|jgi:photosystem II stability/assembly factor-like uncharacterized protein|nr:hypothetical protein [Myxococcota bacterium]